MIITKWRLFNFKSVRDDTEIELKPLTIFAGSNSSGKSTVLQSMLLISQTLWSRDNSKPFILNGMFTRLGQFGDLRSFDSEANQILIGWQLENLNAQSGGLVHLMEFDKIKFNSKFRDDNDEMRFFLFYPMIINCDISFEADPSKGEGNISQLQPRLFSCEITVTGSTESSLSASRRPDFDISSMKKELDIDKKRELDIDNIDPKFYSAVSSALDFRVEIQEDNQIPDDPLNCVLGCVFEHFLPTKLLWKYTEESYQFIEAVGGLKLEDIESASIEEREDDGIEDGTTGKDGVDEDGNLITVFERGGIKNGCSFIQEFFINEIKYLGPLRDEPKPLYPLMPSADDKDIGLRGEFTAAVLNLHKTDQITYIPSASFKSPAVSNLWTERTLESAVTDWLDYLDVAESVKTFDRGKIGHEMKVYMPGSSMAHDLTHVGVGVSQVLPILVICLLAKPNTVILIEQPELHLHPKVQTRLADFFLSMAMLGKQCIIETHSEYIINRLRFRTAAAKAETVASLMKVFFVEKIKGNSVFRPVEINKYGAIIDWPDGFFDQSQAEAEQILSFATQKRKQENGGANHAQRNN